MNRLLIPLAIALAAAPALAFWLGGVRPASSDPIRPPVAILAEGGLPSAMLPSTSFRMAEEDSVYDSAARLAWRYVDSQYQPATGLVNSVVNYPFATVWDIGSALAAMYSAHGLGLLSTEEYERRTIRALETLERLALFDGAAFNKNYQVQRGLPAGRNDRDVDVEGYGWSSTDLGRLLVWLKIVAEGHPSLAPRAERVARRLDYDRIVREGYLWGAGRTRNGRIRSYQEGRIGYEQYAAAGFALWGHYADRALDLDQNAEPVEVFDTPLLTDRRGDARLTSEPFFLIGIELGWWSPAWEEQAIQVLAAQKARFDQTGQVTLVSEDALPIGPYFFYYYTIHGEKRPFEVATVTTNLREGPRWMSTKAAYAWYSLFPGPYTWRGVEAVEPAAGGAGWGSGVYEKSGRGTGGQNLNTAAVILESALYLERRRPLLDTS